MIDKELVNSYFPELEHKPPKYYSKYGILNVGLIKNPKVVTGYQWNYNYLDRKQMKIKYIHSYDLRVLREKVLNLGFEWIITDNRLAIDSYKFNNELLRKRENHIRKDNKKYYGSSGVRYVSKQHDKRYQNKYTWRYYNGGVVISDTSLKCLQSKVVDKGFKWDVVDADLYNQNIVDEPFI